MNCYITIEWLLVGFALLDLVALLSLLSEFALSILLEQAVAHSMSVLCQDESAVRVAMLPEWAPQYI